MSEWWTYHLSDFLLFSSRTYYRLFEIYNGAIWPLQVVGVSSGVLVLVLVFRRAPPPRAPGTWIAAILTASWLWVAVAFHARRYAAINWAAVYFAWAFGLEAVLLIWFGVVRPRLKFERPAGFGARSGLSIFLFALLAMPLVGPLLGRDWKAMEVFGVAPDPTAVATLGALLLAAGPGRGWLMVIPALWCATTGLTLLAMSSPDAWIPPLTALLAVTVAIVHARRRRTRVSVSAPRL